MRTATKALTLALATAATFMAAGPAAAHPHVLVSARAKVMMDSAGRITGINHSWTFDEAYSTYATMGFKKGADGRLDEKEMADLAKLNVESLNEFKYFTSLKRGSKALEFADPAPGYWLDHDGKALTLHFLLPLKEPVKADSSLALRVDDETFFVAFSFAETNPVSIEGGPQTCTINMKMPDKTLAQTDLSKVTEDLFSNLKSGFTDQYATIVRFACK
jgi:ABC-type uncharacterized transport system substrate-binding protein